MFVIKQCRKYTKHYEDILLYQLEYLVEQIYLKIIQKKCLKQIYANSVRNHSKEDLLLTLLPTRVKSCRLDFHKLVKIQ